MATTKKPTYSYVVLAFHYRDFDVIDGEVEVFNEDVCDPVVICVSSSPRKARTTAKAYREAFVVDVELDFGGPIESMRLHKVQNGVANQDTFKEYLPLEGDAVRFPLRTR